MAELTLIACRAQVIDQIEYTISVYCGADGFVAFWQCSECHDEGGNEIDVDSREAALAHCREAIERHHLEKH